MGVTLRALLLNRFLLLASALIAFTCSRAFAQNADPHASHDSMPGMQMPMQMDMNDNASSLPSPHEGSGTSWQPNSVSSHDWMWMRGGWMVMAHGVIFADYNQQGGPRGEGKAESVNWGMLMEQHQARFGDDSVSRDVLCGIVDFAASRISGAVSDGRDLSWRAAGGPPASAQRFRRVVGTLYSAADGQNLVGVYGGPSAEPALGPVTYIHRASAAELPLAPLSHHLQDSTHTSFGVVTTGLVIERFKLEASAFNGHEPNEERWSIQLAALDSWSVRANVAPARNWTAQYSIGQPGPSGGARTWSQWRQTASVEYNRPFANGQVGRHR